MKSKMWCFVAFISIFYLVGFYALVHSLWYAWRSTQAASWPTVPGTISHVALEENSDSEGTSYEVKVKYTYAVNGVSYQGDRLAIGYSGSSGRKAHEEIQRKLNGAHQVTVRYDPADPAVSCLSFGMHRTIQLLLIFAITWLLSLVGFTLFFWLFSQRDSVLLDNLLVQ